MYFGLVARDSDGFVQGGRMGVVDKEGRSEWVELMALEESIYFARSKRWNKVDLKTDYVSLVNHFNNRDINLTTFGHRIREIHMELNSFFLFFF